MILASLASRDELAGLASADDLRRLASRDELAGLASADDLRRLASNHLSQLVFNPREAGLASWHDLGQPCVH